MYSQKKCEHEYEIGAWSGKDICKKCNEYKDELELNKLIREYNVAIANGLVLKAHRINRRILAMEKKKS